MINKISQLTGVGLLAAITLIAASTDATAGNRGRWNRGAGYRSGYSAPVVRYYASPNYRGYVPRGTSSYYGRYNVQPYYGNSYYAPRYYGNGYYNNSYYGSGYYGNGYYRNGYYGNGFYNNRFYGSNYNSPGANLGATIGGAVGGVRGANIGGAIGAAVGN